MSIPPLVCSTPPPPDQCEEDKDPDDFDIPYNLSQDDDDDSFGYGDFSSYGHYQSNCVAQEKETSKNGKVINILETKPTDLCDNNQTYSEDKQHNMRTKANVSKPKSEEDINIEDLGLEVNDVSISSSEKEDEQSEADNFNVDNTEHVLDVRNDPHNIDEKPLPLGTEESLVDMIKTVQRKESLNDGTDVSIDIDFPTSKPNALSNDEICKNDLNFEEVICENDPQIKQIISNNDLTIEEIDCKNDPPIEENVCKSNNAIEEVVCRYNLSMEDNNEIARESNLDDGFGDFEDFQFAGTENKASDIIDNCDNPWNTNAVEDNIDFGNFTANFETIQHQNYPLPNDNAAEELKDSNSDGDDFGDFDDFQSSVVDNDVRELSLESGSDQSLPVINFHAADSDHQVMESIAKVLSSVFEEEISEPENEYDGRLEAMLSETWGHLQETDVRQPYIVNWNNSLGQKTLLRALCIDSRNILFGPKWSYNMPKYAVNLSAAPLQPLKPLAPSNPSQTDASAEKTIPQPGQGGWTDPFTADGQEFTYAEALLLDLEHLMATLDQMAHNHSTLKISELLSHACNTERESVVEVTATDLDVFEAAISSKPDKIYSSTLNVQPLRQISLPDTHIFTPTDSQTPTSKTVHYDNVPPILLPQNIIESTQTVSSTVQHTSDSPKDGEDEYWDFQDYKSSSDKTSTAGAAPLSSTQPEQVPELKPTLNPNVTYQTQVLQPIRMEPLIPTVNWPDPGEIKETFDDFSDFVSNSTWSDKRQEQVNIPISENKSAAETTVLDKINDKHKNIQGVDTPTVENDFDDDFDTFQSALPPKHIASDFNIDSLGTFKNIPPHNSTQIADFDNAFPKTNNATSETISISNSMKPNEAVGLNQTAITSTSNKIFSPSSNAVPNFLQPISTSSIQTKQKAGQILQPLSLESYSQINWPNPGIDLQDLSRFNPVETLQSLKTDLSVGGPSKGSSPVHNHKNVTTNQVADEDIWGEFVSSKPKQQSSIPKKPASFPDDDEWTDFVSSPSVKPHNGLNTISLNVHTNSNVQKTSSGKFAKNNQMPLDIPTLNYITPKASGHSSYNDRHFQNL